MANTAGIIVVAAGKGSRMGTVESKQYLKLQDKPIIIHTLEVFERSAVAEEIVIVTGAEDVERCREWVRQYGLHKVQAVVVGGHDRQESVYRGLEHIQSDWVMVHDGVRPFITEQHMEQCLEAAQRDGASVLAVPVKDTIKQVDQQFHITGTPDRSTLWAIQTPQTFRSTDLRNAHRQAEEQQFRGTDDAMLVERLGIPVTVVEGSYSNIKLTTPDDLDYAAYLLTHKGENLS